MPNASPGLNLPLPFLRLPFPHSHLNLSSKGFHSFLNAHKTFLWLQP